MRIVLQRVKEASVATRGTQKAFIAKGLVLLVGIGKGDNEEAARKMAGKISKMRIFEDDAGKMNLDIRQTGGEVLSVPQFTLFGDTEKGNRPGFDNAAEPGEAKKLWEKFNAFLEEENIVVKTGEFGYHMDVRLVNSGPVTFVLDTEKGGVT